MVKKTPEEICDAIESHGTRARMASRFPEILNSEVKNGGYESGDPETEEVKNKVAATMRQRRLERRAS